MKTAREDLEKDFLFQGFMILENKLKEKTITTIQELNSAKI